MNRRKKYFKNCISVVALAMALTVSVRPLSVSAENTPDADVLEEESQELPAADLPGGDGEFREEQYTSEITEGETPEKEAETAGQDGDEQAEKEAEANGSEDNQENQVQAQAEFSQTDSSGFPAMLIPPRFQYRSWDPPERRPSSWQNTDSRPLPHNIWWDH